MSFFNLRSRIELDSVHDIVNTLEDSDEIFKFIWNAVDPSDVLASIDKRPELRKDFRSLIIQDAKLSEIFGCFIFDKIGAQLRIEYEDVILDAFDLVANKD